MATQRQSDSWTSKRQQSRRREGYTFIEMTLALMLMALVATLTVPRFMHAVDHHRVKSAALRLADDMNRARGQAKSTSQVVSATFLIPTNSYSFSSSMHNLDRPGQAYTVPLNAPPYKVQLVSADFDGQTTVSFNSFGVPDHGGQVVLKSADHLATVEINNSTGIVTIQ